MARSKTRRQSRQPVPRSPRRAADFVWPHGAIAEFAEEHVDDQSGVDDLPADIRQSRPFLRTAQRHFSTRDREITLEPIAVAQCAEWSAVHIVNALEMLQRLRERKVPILSE